MAKLIALIRGINVGTAKRVAMADLRSIISDLGYKNVRTLLNSGNAVFSGPVSKNSARRIEEALKLRTGISARVIVLTGEELAQAVADNPLVSMADNHSRLMVSVLADPADLARLKPLLQEDWSPDVLAIGAKVFYMWCPAGVLDSRLSQSVSRLLGDGVTARNWSTVTKLNSLE